MTTRNNTATATTTNATTTTTTTTTATTTLQPFDVLSGRDKQSFNHIGNRRFRVVIGMNLQRYLDTNSRYERSEMILAFVRELRGDANMRFIKRRGSKYIELNEKQSREKVGHALRDAAAQARAQQENQDQTNVSKPISKSKISKRKQQQKLKNQNIQNQEQHQQRPSQSLVETLPLTFSSPSPSQEEATTSMMRMSFNPSSAFVNEYDEEEFSLSDESLDSLLSLVDEEEMKYQQQQQEQHQTQELLDLDTPAPIQFDNTTATESMTMTTDNIITHIDQNELAEFLVSQHPSMVAVEL